MGNKIKRLLLGLVITLVLVITSANVEGYAATITYKVPIIAYTLNGRVNTYQKINGNYSGYIASGDQCDILEVYDSGWVKVRYPISSGYKIAYARSEYFFSNVDFLTSETAMGCDLTVYRRSDMVTKLGTVYANDSIIIVGDNGINTQIIYPVSGGYKMGWIKGIHRNTVYGMETRIPDGYYQIKSSINSNYVLDVYGAYEKDEANVQIYHNCAGFNQAFLIVEQEDGYYTIEALHSGKVLDVYRNEKVNGANIIQCQKHGGDNQLWKIYRTSDGFYSLQSKSSGLFLDISGGIIEDERNIQLWEANGTGAQKFEFARVTVNGQAFQGSNAEERARVVSYLNECATIRWSPKTTFTHWSGGRVWKKGVTYYGIPYSQTNRATTLEEFKRNMLGTYYIGPTGQTTYMGSDCSSAVAMAYATVDTDFPITATFYMFPNYEYMEMVGIYYTGGLEDSAAICGLNSKETMYDAYRCLQPGDLLLETNHVMMVTEVGEECVKVTHQSTYDSSRSSTWRVNEKKSYSQLYREGYIPVTLKEWDTVTQSSNATGFDPIWPCENTYVITALYKYTGGQIHSCRFKYGIDIGAPSGENVLAVENGTVICSEYSRTSGFGNWIMIQHENGKVSLYAHLSSRKVFVGDVVDKGQVIGCVGNTSAKYSLAAHLHFELGDGNVSGAAGDAYQEFYKSKYADKIVLTQAARLFNEP